ncbi:class I SAM-dependent methyltransferase [Gloeocapsopsis dulcis]|uniref:SAM-dependent methyltransferase n=1 Tax=Gloeocapsopsis dulcis AAB1 = 1H9 TaxID=1433147 RepID=A0A6N8FWI4_9CHRO|nr:class I SAM-dependent methyltransferase [Gloeocapsopsis dulcis]MUL37134.1 SAM-dependent methyltransferase [Gloeocapsopsis dulcis AAB1 = 1H9]WNN88419.1 class I SAM-dependent methyltransferase [Gloeocapsopsis dulcis]
MQKTIDFDANPPVASTEYDDRVRRAIPGYEAIHTMALSFLKLHLPETANLLIVGAGTGMELVKFGKSNSQWQLLGVDPSTNMLAIAQQKITENGLSERVKLFQGYTHDLANTPLYDAATCILVMHFLPDDGSKLALLQSIAQRLQSSAAFVLVDIFGEKGSREFEQITTIIKLFWEEMGIPPERINEGLETINKSVYPITESRTIELLQQAGFGNMIRFYTGLWGGGWVATIN